VTCGEWLAFIEDGGYHRPELWLSDGWAHLQSERVGEPALLDAAGRRVARVHARWDPPVNPAQPVCHVSYYEADAFAHWAGARLPTEAEWEVAVPVGRSEGHFLDQTRLHPARSPVHPPRPDPFGDVWQWTSSAYSPYPGFEPAPGAVGEYNGKFMVNQYVLRGGSCVTPPDHIRPPTGTSSHRRPLGLHRAAACP
jgi:ergothioneine biosynthesis protein EgtB